MELTLRLDSLTRVYQIWFAVFCLRSWRYSMSCESVFPLSKHFLMLNAHNWHKCAKINAHCAVMLLIRLSKDGTPNLFNPWLMSSQPCVYYFECACSFTSVGSLLFYERTPNQPSSGEPLGVCSHVERRGWDLWAFRMNTELEMSTEREANVLEFAQHVTVGKHRKGTRSCASGLAFNRLSTNFKVAWAIHI